MMRPDRAIGERLAELRQAFDRSFAETPSASPAEYEDFLAIRVATNPYALRLVEISVLFADRTITPLPDAAPGLLGIAGFRGEILPVYDLRALLGYSGTVAQRWLVIVAGTPIALSFDAFDGHLRLARSDIVPNVQTNQAGHVREVVRAGDRGRPIVHVASILEAVTRQAKRIPRQE